jgi:hypothetical protein
MKKKKPKPLATVGTGPIAEIYRGKFIPFEITKYLDLAKLKQVEKARIEIGRVEGGGLEATLVAEIKRGAITKVAPRECKGCQDDRRAGSDVQTKRREDGTGRRTGTAALKKLAREVLVRQHELGLPLPKFPIPLRAAPDLEITIGPVTVVIGGETGVNVCVSYDDDDGFSCYACAFQNFILCVGPGKLS